MKKISVRSFKSLYSANTKKRLWEMNPLTLREKNEPLQSGL